MKRAGSVVIILGFVLIAFAANVLIFTYYPVLSSQIKYLLTNHNKEVVVIGQNEEVPVGKKVIRPQDENYGIVIPKIDANSKVIADVDPYDSKIYQRALTQGVAHAKGTSFPGQNGNVFIFSHSSVNPLESARYNSVFYLLSKLEPDDDIYIFYRNQKFAYKVIQKKVVDPQDTQYLEGQGIDKTLTLMTCTPPGTTLKRLLVIAQAVG